VKSPVFVLTLVALAVAAAAGVAVDRAAAARSARDEREEAQRQLEKAVALAAQHPRAFGARSALPAREAGLKSLAQETATERNVTIGYLSETERDADKGCRERQVIIRVVNVGHANLVLFLQDLENRGGGARIKEIHVRPSREIVDTYEEAEIVLSKIAQESKP
jgi:hypothetical protein